MKKTFSLILALAIALGCLASLGGCGKTVETGKVGFIENETYFSALSGLFSKAIAPTDFDNLEKLRASEKVNGADFNFALTKLDGIELLMAGGDSSQKDQFLSLFSSLFPLGIGGSAILGEDYVSLPLRLSFGEDSLSFNAQLEDTELTLALPDIFDKALALELGDYMPIDDLLEESHFMLDLLLDETVEKLWDAAVESIDPTLFIDTAGELPTPDGNKEYKAISLNLGATELVGVLSATVKALIENPEFAPLLDKVAYLYGATADEIKKQISDTLARLDSAKLPAELKDASISWTRYLDGDGICADKLSFNAGGARGELFAGITSSKSADHGFFSVSANGKELMRVDTTAEGSSATLVLEVATEEGSAKLTFTGEESKVDGKPQTVSSVKVGIDSMSIQLLTITTTLNEQNGETLDISSVFDFSLPEALLGTKLGASFELDLKIGEFKTEPTDIPDDSLLSVEQFEPYIEALGEEVLDPLKTKAPTLYSVIEFLLLSVSSPASMGHATIPS